LVLPNRGKYRRNSAAPNDVVAPMSGPVSISVPEATDLTLEVLTGLGVPAGGAALQADLWIAAETAGLPSHGLLRLPTLADRIRRGLADPRATGDHSWHGEAFLHVTGQQGLGPVVASRAIDALVERVDRTGIAVAAIAHANHLGMLAWYAERVAARGYTLLGTTTSEALVHPWGGATAMVGTNPLVIGVPAAPHPLVLDMSTGLVSMGKIKDHAHRGAPLEPGWALDAEGRPTLDAVAAQAGSIAPFGGPKGFALGLALEVLVATLTGTSLGTDVRGTLDAEHPATKGDVFLVADSRRSGQLAAVTAYLDAVRRSPAVEPGRPVRIPGDRARRQREHSTREGLVLPADLWTRLLALRDDVRDHHSTEHSTDSPAGGDPR
jgi:L-2-hydroxycarboxylate dehydrogenase (NAD+)